jgi:hypothetical protein
MVVRQAMLLAGRRNRDRLGAAFGLTRWMNTLLFQVKATDPLVFTTVAVVLERSHFFASYLPARRACERRPDDRAALRMITAFCGQAGSLRRVGNPPACSSLGFTVPPTRSHPTIHPYSTTT